MTSPTSGRYDDLTRQLSEGAAEVEALLVAGTPDDEVKAIAVYADTLLPAMRRAHLAALVRKKEVDACRRQVAQTMRALDDLRQLGAALARAMSVAVQASAVAEGAASSAAAAAAIRQALEPLLWALPRASR